MRSLRRKDGTQNTGEQGHLRVSTTVPPCQKAIPQRCRTALLPPCKVLGVKWTIGWSLPSTSSQPVRGVEATSQATLAFQTPRCLPGNTGANRSSQDYSLLKAQRGSEGQPNGVLETSSTSQAMGEAGNCQKYKLQKKHS